MQVCGIGEYIVEVEQVSMYFFGQIQYVGFYFWIVWVILVCYVWWFCLCIKFMSQVWLQCWGYLFQYCVDVVVVGELSYVVVCEGWQFLGCKEFFVGVGGDLLVGVGEVVGYVVVLIEVDQFG